jgi:capsid protein
MIAPNEKDVRLYDGNGNRVVSFGYKAADNNGNRKPGPKKTTHEDFQLPPKKAKKLVAEARDQIRNYAIVAWMVRKHLAYVSQFNFKIRTGNEDLNKRLMRHFANAQKKENFDIAKRHSMQRAMSLFEMAKVVEGDAALIKLKNGSIQLVESDLIATPESGLPETFAKRITDRGLILNRFGAVDRYCLCRWDDDGKKKLYERMLKPDNVIYDGYFTRAAQTRGASPLTAALDQFKDLFESWEWTLLKIKVHALLGFAFYRDSEDTVTGLSGIEYEDPDEDVDGAENNATGYDIKLDGNLLNLDLEDNDKVDLLESKTPHSGATEFQEAIIRCALMALDVPYTMYNSHGGTFAMAKADRAEYEHSAKQKRASNLEAWESWRDWKLLQFIADDGELAAMVSAQFGNVVDDPYAFLDFTDTIKVVPGGMPWIDRKDEAESAGIEIGQGTNSRQRILKQRGEDFFEIADELAEEESYLASRGVSIAVGMPGANIIGQNGQSEGGSNE